MLAKSEELEAGGRALKGASVKSEASQASGGLGLVKRTDSFHSSPSLSTRTVEGLKAFPTKLSVLPLGKGNRRSEPDHFTLRFIKVNPASLAAPRPKANA